MTCIQEFKTITARQLFEWNANINWARNRSKVIKVVDGNPNVQLLKSIRTIISYIYTQTIMEKAEISSKFQRTVTFRQKLIATFIFTDAFKIKSPILSFGKIRASFAYAGSDTDP